MCRQRDAQLLRRLSRLLARQKDQKRLAAKQPKPHQVRGPARTTRADSRST